MRSLNWYFKRDFKTKLLFVLVALTCSTLLVGVIDTLLRIEESMGILRVSAILLMFTTLLMSAKDLIHKSVTVFVLIALGTTVYVSY